MERSFNDHSNSYKAGGSLHIDPTRVMLPKLDGRTNSTMPLGNSRRQGVLMNNGVLPWLPMVFQASSPDPSFSSSSMSSVSTSSGSASSGSSFSSGGSKRFGMGMQYQVSASSPPSSSSATSSTPQGGSNSHGESSEEDTELHSDIVLKYISDMLMDENMEDKKCMYQECSAFQATVKPFYDILGESYPPCKTEKAVGMVSSTPEMERISGNYKLGQFHADPLLNSSSFFEFGSDNIKIDDSSWIGEFFDSQYESSLGGSSSQISFSSSGSRTLLDGDQPSPVYELGLPKIFSGNSFALGDESRNGERHWNGNSLAVGDESRNGERHRNGIFLKLPKNETDGHHSTELKLEQKEEFGSCGFLVGKSDDANNGASARQKNVHRDEVDFEDRQRSKHSANYSENVIRTETFDEVLLCQERNGKNFSVIQKEVLQNGVQKTTAPLQESATVKGTAKGRGKKQGKKEVIDLRALLIHCAQTVANDDHRGANEILKQIKQHASPFGDGSQRLAHYFAESLVARLSGTGGQLYTMQITHSYSAAEILKAYQLYLVANPFKKVSHYMTNQTICELTENATTVHIVDFGILYGFQWPCLIQRLGSRPGGPPKLRITGIDFPQPGFKPTQRVEETGSRLTDYANSFGVPFEYNAIATKWENLDIDELKLKSDEILVVNCMYRLRNLMDETVVLESPRSIVLNKIRRMNPHVFIQGVVNGAYNAPFFITRFREALFHYSALFDALETTVPRDHPERLVLEKEVMGREILNVVACEGLERMERPETYKQWQVRTKRAGFKQLPLNPNILKKARERVEQYYHKDFGVDQDGGWMLHGWKGRITYALTIWVPDS